MMATSTTPLLSVVIPCYNHGHFIQEAIDSVLPYKGCAYEIIIVDDGSTDPATVTKLQELAAGGYQVLTQKNSGLPACTRNTGIEAAKGKYILPLDADNKIKPAYIEQALPLLESGDFDIVYARPRFFGDISSRKAYTTRAFDIVEIAVENYIDACAVYRKEVWEQLNGYDVHMPYPGNEDWEFWIHAFTKDYRFRFLNEELFYYRIANNSMITSTFHTGKTAENQQYIFSKHAALFRELLLGLYYNKKMHERDIKNPFRSFFKYTYYNLFARTKKTGLPPKDH